MVHRRNRRDLDSADDLFISLLQLCTLAKRREVMLTTHRSPLLLWHRPLLK